MYVSNDIFASDRPWSHLTCNLFKQWDLALIDLALYRPVDASGIYVVVPHLRNLVRSEPRQVCESS
jgi:hypothetical protein